MSEARTGNRVNFIVGLPDMHDRILVTVHDYELNVDLANGLTPARSSQILHWFEPLAMANRTLYR